MNGQSGMFRLGWRVHMVPPIVFAILSFRLRAGIDGCHVSLPFDLSVVKIVPPSIAETGSLKLMQAYQQYR